MCEHGDVFFNYGVDSLSKKDCECSDVSDPQKVKT